MYVYNSMLELTGNTPIVRLKKIEEQFQLDSVILAKLEMFNPSGSIKVRPAKNMVLKALHEGLITTETTLIEPTSGNMGIALAFVAACLGMKFIAVMPENVTDERIKIIKAYGANVVLTDIKLGMAGSVDKAKELAMELNGFILSQFDNLNNPQAHYETTAKEICDDTNGKVDTIVCGVGTGGTISGIGQYVKRLKDIKMVAVEPLASPMLSKGEFSVHKIAGIGPNFIPETLNMDVVDKIVGVSDEEAYEYTRLLALQEGIFVGISSGAALAGAIKYIKENNIKEETIVIILPDTGERYLSTKLAYEK